MSSALKKSRLPFSTMNKTGIFFIGMVLTLSLSCGEENQSPKPKGYPRTDFPVPSYERYESDCPFSFEVADYARVMKTDDEHKCWLNIDYPFLKGRIHFSYNEVDGDLKTHLEDARTLVYRHTIKASAINESEFLNREKRVFARIYELEGNAASAIQFYATDSLNHFVRAALYFNARTNSDSLKPSIDFIKEDVYHLVESLEWRE